MERRAEVGLPEPLLRDKFRLDTAGPQVGRAAVLFRRRQRGAIAVHINRHPPVGNLLTVRVHQRIEARQFGLVSFEQEHIRSRPEAERDGFSVRRRCVGSGEPGRRRRHKKNQQCKYLFHIR